MRNLKHPKGQCLVYCFLIDMLPLGNVIRSYGISFHCYADDTQIYISVTLKDSSQILKVECGSTAIKSWMTQNYLQLNTGKTEQTTCPKQLQTQFKAVCFDGLVFPQILLLKQSKDYPLLCFNQYVKSVTRIELFLI